MGKGGAIWLNDFCLTEINKIIGAAAFYNNKRYKPTKVVEDLLKLRDIPRIVQQRLTEETDSKTKEVLRWILNLCLEGAK